MHTMCVIVCVCVCRERQFADQNTRKILELPTTAMLYSTSIVPVMECAIGMARRAMALPDFKLVGPAIHLALPEFF